jgi:acyl-CoA synthetase (NDP forming)
MTHKLDPLLRPRSIAVIGASEREASVGCRTVHNLLAGNFEGNIYPVNPGRDSVLGLKCYPGLSSLPETVDHVVFAVSDARVEATLKDTIEHGAKAVTIMSQLILADDTIPLLQQRIEQLVEESGILVCGANAMGFYNCHDGVWLCGFDTRENHARGGNVTLISHSGSGMCGIVDCEERIDFNLAVSTGQEINVAMHDYMNFAIEQHDTRVIGLFMETVRNPQAMTAALKKARDRGIPVVAIKVGRTELSARLAESHSGAVAGQDAAYEALFHRFGVQRVNDMDEFATTLMMFAQPHDVADGGLVTLHDSGGERQLLVDLADELDVHLAELSKATTEKLESLLDPGLPPVNPLDAWGAGGPDSDQVMADCLTAMMQDPAAAFGAVVHDRAPYSAVYPTYIEYMRQARRGSGKPVFLVSNRQGSGADPLAVDATREGFPVIDGLRSFLCGVTSLLDYRDYRKRKSASPPSIDPALIDELKRVLSEREIDESAALAHLRQAGLPIIQAKVVSDVLTAQTTAEQFGFPVVMKTARSDIRHKTEVDGIRMPMIASDGLEMILGMTLDPQFGPLVIMGLGGVRVEAIRDVVSLMPPFDADTVKRRLNDLQHSQLLNYDRGEGTPDIDSFCETAALFSVLVASLGDAVEEIDMNPVIVLNKGCT